MRFTPSRSILKPPGQPSLPLPPMHRRAANAAKAAARVVGALVSGRKVWLTPAKQEEHQAICRANTCGFFRERDQRCAHPNCGCFTKLKTKLATEECPAGLFSRGA